MKQQRAKKSIILARVSTEEQARDDHHSIPAQLKNLREYCERKELEIIAEYEFDESASKDRRKKFETAIKEVETSKEPLAITVDKVDRFQRGFKETVRFDELRKEGRVELHFASQSLVIWKNSAPHDLMIWDMLVMMARGYVLQISANVKRSLKYKLEQGQYPGYVPTGYINKVVKISEDRVEHKIIPDPEKAPLIKKAFELYAADKYSLNDLAIIMARAGLKTRQRRMRVDGRLIEREPRPLSKQELNWILRNPFYIGRFRYKNPETGEVQVWDNKDTYEPIIPKRLFKKVQTILGRKSQSISKFEFYKFRGLITCGFCGCKLTPEDMWRNYKDKEKVKGKYIYYRCTSGKKSIDPNWYERLGTRHSGVVRNKKGEIVRVSCPQRYWKEEEIEEDIKEVLGVLHYDEKVFERIRKALRSDFEQRMELTEAQVKSLNKEKTEEEQLKRELIRSIAKEKDPELKFDFKKEYEAIKLELEKIEEDISFYEKAMEIDADKIVDTMIMLSDLKQQYEKLDDEKKRELVMLCFSRISARRGETRIKGRKVGFDSLDFGWNEPFSDLLEQGLDKILADIEGGKGSGGASHWPITKVASRGVAFDSLGQKQRVFEPYSLSLSSMVAVAISQNLCPEHSNQLSRKWRCLRQIFKTFIIGKKNIK